MLGRDSRAPEIGYAFVRITRNFLFRQNPGRLHLAQSVPRRKFCGTFSDS